MERHSILFAVDDRQRHLAEILGKRREYLDLRETEKLGEIVSSAEWVILPTPVGKIMEEPAFKKVRSLWTPRQRICGGKFPEELKKDLKSKGISFEDFMEDEIVTEKNAKITAEAVVAETIMHSEKALEGQKIVITGFGRCARYIADKLSALGGQITILARNRRQRQEARILGYCAADFAYGPEEVCGTQIIINTVPAEVITECLIRQMPAGAMVLDIASAPGGCNLRDAEKYGVAILKLPGLPGRYETAAGAKIFAEAIRRKWGENSIRKEEKTWIFQVLPSDME